MIYSVQHVKRTNDMQTTVGMQSCSINNITQILFFIFYFFEKILEQEDK
jgi:hypothetical protein